jgi:hypothetical protein
LAPAASKSLKLRLLITLGITPHQILKDQTALDTAATDISIVGFQAADGTQPYSSASEVAFVVADLLDLTISAAKDQSRARDLLDWLLFLWTGICDQQISR